MCNMFDPFVLGLNDYIIHPSLPYSNLGLGENTKLYQFPEQQQNKLYLQTLSPRKEINLDIE